MAAKLSIIRSTTPPADSYVAGVRDERVRWQGIMARLLALLERPSVRAALILGLVLASALPAHAGFNRLVLDWLDNASTEVSQRVERKAEACAGAVVPFTQIATLAPNIVTYVDTAVTVGQAYCYRVRAEGTGALFSAYSNTAQGTPDGAPSSLTVK